MNRLIKFNSRGFLEPPEPIFMTITDIESHFVTNTYRKSLFANLLTYISELNKICRKPLRYWINGSFATKKANPSDIDLCVFIEHQLFEENKDVLSHFGCQKNSTFPTIDAYIVLVYPENHPTFKSTYLDTIFWLNQWSKTAPNRARKQLNKGFIEIIA